MEMSELNEDILEGESNSEILNQTEPQIAPNNVEPLEKAEDGESEKTTKKDENEDFDDLSLTKIEGVDSGESEPKGASLPEIVEDKQNDNDEPVTKKIKLDESNETIKEENASEKDQQTREDEMEQDQSEIEPTLQSEGVELNEQKDEEGKAEIKGEKEEEKNTAGLDTDMLATLASAALEQDPKDKSGTATPIPKSPVIKAEPETPKKKPEMWCNVGVFDTNTTIVSDYLATPEPNEQVDLVTATLGGRRIQLEPGTAYKFRVCAVNGCGTGPWSDIAAFKTTLPGFPGAPSAIKISKSPEGAHLTWEPPGGNSSEILEYAVYLAVRSASQGCQPVTTNQAQLAFVRVFCGPTNKCMVGTNSLQAAHIDTTTKPAIIFRIAARNSKGYGPATQVRWLQESQNGSSQGVKRAVKT